jgi:hypothetical protein
MPLNVGNPQRVLDYSSDIQNHGARAAVDKNRCEDWERLLKQYQAITKTYADAVADLPNGRREEFDGKWMRSESLRRASVGARADLLEHEYKHGCSNPVEVTLGGR